MNSRDAGIVGLKMLGLLYAFDTVTSTVEWVGLVGLGPIEGMPDPPFLLVSQIVASVLKAGIAVTLILRAEPIGYRLFPRPEPAGTTSRADLQTVAFAVVGVVLLASVLPPLVRMVMELVWYLGGKRRAELNPFLRNSVRSFIELPVSFGVGYVLFVKAGWLARYRERRDSNSLATKRQPAGEPS